MPKDVCCFCIPLLINRLLHIFFLRDLSIRYSAKLIHSVRCLLNPNKKKPLIYPLISALTRLCDKPNREVLGFLLELLFCLRDLLRSLNRF